MSFLKNIYEFNPEMYWICLLILAIIDHCQVSFVSLVHLSNLVVPHCLKLAAGLLLISHRPVTGFIFFVMLFVPSYLVPWFMSVCIFPGFWLCADNSFLQLWATYSMILFPIFPSIFLTLARISRKAPINRLQWPEGNNNRFHMNIWR